MNLLNKLFKRPKLTPEQQALIQLADGLKILENHLIAISRLQFIRPETLIREANNVKSNSEYLNTLVELRNKNAK